MAGGKQPGVMLYFTLRPGLKALSLEEKGMLLDAIFSYGEDGIEPAFNSPALAITWGFVQPLLDADKQRYQDRCKNAQKAIEARWNRVRENTDVYERIPLNEAYTNHTNSIHLRTSNNGIFNRLCKRHLHNCRMHSARRSSVNSGSDESQTQS